MGQQILQGLNVSIIGMTITISSLIALMILIMVLSRIVNALQNKKLTTVSVEPVLDSGKLTIVQAPPSNPVTNDYAPAVANMKSDNELIAIFAAAIAYTTGAAASSFRVVSFKESNVGAPIWNVRGRNDYLSGKL